MHSLSSLRVRVSGAEHDDLASAANPTTPSAPDRRHTPCLEFRPRWARASQAHAAVRRLPLPSEPLQLFGLPKRRDERNDARLRIPGLLRSSLRARGQKFCRQPRRASLRWRRPPGPRNTFQLAGPAIGKAFFAAPLSTPPKAFPAGDRIMLPAVREILLINLPRNWSSSCSSVTKQTLNFRTDRATASREIHWGDKRRFNSNRYPLTVLRRVAAPRPRCRRRREPGGRNPAYRRYLQASDSRGNETKPYLSP